MSFIIIYVTHENITEAKKIGNYLLKQKKIACANYLPIQSAYWWNASIESNNEYVSIFKTSLEYWDIVKLEIEKIHPYDVPCIMKIEVEANESYEKWIHNETKSDNY